MNTRVRLSVERCAVHFLCYVRIQYTQTYYLHTIFAPPVNGKTSSASPRQ